MESLLISLLILVIFAVAIYYVAGMVPEPAGKILRIVLYVGLALWLVLHVREIIHAIASCC